LLHRYEVEKVDSGTYQSGYVVRIKLKPDEVPDLAGFELRYIYKHFAARGFGSGRDVNIQDKQQIQDFMNTSILKDLGIIQFCFPNQMYVDFSSMSSLIFADHGFDMKEYEKVITNQGAKIIETKAWNKSNVNQRHHSDYALELTFPVKYKNGGIVFHSGGEWDDVKDLVPDYAYSQSTRRPTNVRTFEILGETEEPWDETSVRSSFAKLLEKELMSENVKIIEVTFTNRRTLCDEINAFSDVKDVAEKRLLLDDFRMRKKIPGGKKGVVVIYEKEYGEYNLEVYGESKSVLEKALSQLS
jgi:hypothetical protein